ncbi:MAG: hypothetical protein N2489_01560 [Clostridia bacterium]|nr:hypothetical protein [Clostridia bacterium]
MAVREMERISQANTSADNEPVNDRLGPFNAFLGTISFIAFGVISYMDLKAPLEIANIVFGAIVGLLAGFLCKKLIYWLIALLNKDLRQQHGKEAILKTVHRSTVFMFPFALMLALSTFLLGWTTGGVFFSAAVMNTGVMASAEIAKLKGKAAIKNTIVTSVSASIISYSWLLSAGYLKNAPGLLKSLAGFVLPLMGVKI